MSEQNQSVPAIPLPERQKQAVQWGCVLLMLSVAMYGSIFGTLTSPLLERIDAMSYVSLFTIFGGFGVTLMTPIGGKLSEIVGRRDIVVIPGLVCVAAGVAIAFVRSLWPLMALRLLVSLAQGTFTASPYILAGMIHVRKDVPRAMGLLATAVAVGGFGGSILAGLLTDAGMLWAAILTPALPALAAILLIGRNLPNLKRETASVDVPGIAALTLTLAGFVLAFNFGPTLGWSHLLVLAGFALLLFGTVAVYIAEKKASDPLIPLRLFKNRAYLSLLLVNFIYFFYSTAMTAYAPIGAMHVIGASTTAAGTLQLPRTAITIFLPALAGTWVGKKNTNRWKAMALATGLVALPYAVMGMTTTTTPLMVYLVSLAISGIAESFRSVSFTPSAQATLDTRDLGVGTSLFSFSSSLASTISATVYGLAYNLCTAAAPANTANIQAGVNWVFRIVAIVNLAGLLVVLLIIRPQMKKE